MVFDDIYAQYKVVIHHVMRKLRIYKDFAHYEQTGAIALWQAYEKFEGDWHEFGGYAYTFIRFALLAELKKQATYEQRAQLTGELYPFERIVPLPPESPLFDKIEQLKEADQQLLYALYVEKMSYEQLSQQTGMTIAALKKRRQRLLAKLRQNRRE